MGDKKHEPIPDDPDMPNRINNPSPKKPKERPDLPDEPEYHPDPDEHLIKPEVQDPKKQKED